MCFIKENELKLAQVELFSFFHFMYAAANVSKLCCMAHLANFEPFFYTIPNCRFKYQILHKCKVASLSWRKSTQIRESEFSLGNE